MSKKVKIWLVAASVLVTVGAIIFAGVISMLKWDFSKLTTIRFQTKNYEITDDFKNVEIKTKTAQIEFVMSDDEKCSVNCVEQVKLSHSVNVEGVTLSIRVVDTRRWYEHIGISFKKPKITVALPKDAYEKLVISTNTGDISIPHGFTFESIDITQTTGDVTSGANASGDIKIESVTGDIKLENVTADNVSLHVTTGDVKVSKMQCQELKTRATTGHVKLTDVIAKETFNIKVTTGDVTLDKCDAQELEIKTSTGDVKGTILSDKVYVAKASTGKVRVPDTASGGRCKITTTTGNITINK